ncbi:class I SAM-dependent methyltransferase [Mesomycoplasma lagogenitalium]|uniref:Class I SAM-dependent methyltransferase n=1 Tax=Mesomycoplasma lagogenitalium TaxID=171286 RepID=A0ABY8LT36_9BACT|nr:class I SAM-dependent methyltransferase [Mesomycoplasma lagogenitalium]WGI36412.1 class I SAM-dependent methyltransferase [Mesomycoplasma lagogenitalium]
MNNKKAFLDPKTVLDYSNATLNVKLWKSEEFLINKYVNKDAKILDLGCGSGRTTFALYEQNYKNIVACDISQAMIENAKIINEDKKYLIDFLVADATNLPFETNTFDFVLFSFNGWPGIPLEKSRINALKEVERILKDNGIFIFTAHERDEKEYLLYYKNYLEECSEFTYEKYGNFIFKNENKICDFLHLYSKTELIELISNNTNLTILEIVDRDKNFYESNEVKKFSDNTTFWILKK